MEADINKILKFDWFRLFYHNFVHIKHTDTRFEALECILKSVWRSVNDVSDVNAVITPKVFGVRVYGCT